MEWKKAAVNIPTGPLQQAADILSDSGELYGEVIKAAGKVLQLLSTAQSFSDATSSAMHTVLEAVDDTIPSDFLHPDSQASAYLLDIPLINPERHRPMPPTIKSGVLEDILLATSITRPGNSVTGSGGNYGIYKTLIDSIFDAGDPSRPVLSADCETGTLIVLYGSKRYGRALQVALQMYDLFGDAMSLPPDVHLHPPVPQNVKVRPVSDPACAGKTVETVRIGLDSGNPFAAKVRWDKIPVADRIPASPLSFRFVSWHVFVKEGSPIEPGERLTQYEVLNKKVPTHHNTYAGLRLKGVPSSALLTSLDPDTTYYVSVAFNVNIVDEEGDDRSGGFPLPVTYARLSEQVRLRISEQVPSTQYTAGTPPDWHSIRSPLYVVPQIREAYDRMYGLVDVVRENYATQVNEVDELLENATAQVNNFVEKAGKINDAIMRISRSIEAMTTLEGSTSGLWGTAFYGSGGKAQFISQVGTALLDERTPGIPPFTAGTEPVGALVFMVEGHTMASVEAMLGPISRLFSLGGGIDSAVSVIEDLSDDPLADAGVTGRSPEGSVSHTEEATSTRGLGLSASEEEDTIPASLHDVGVDDDPC